MDVDERDCLPASDPAHKAVIGGSLTFVSTLVCLLLRQGQLGLFSRDQKKWDPTMPVGGLRGSYACGCCWGARAGCCSVSQPL